MMKRLFASLSLAATSALAAQQPAVPAMPMTPVKLDGIRGIVGDQVITRFELRDAVLAKIQRGEIEEPKTVADSAALETDVLNDMVQDELLIQKSKDLKITITDADVAPQVDRQVKDTRARFPNETQFRSELLKAGLGTPEEYRRYLMDQFKRQMTRQRVIAKLTQDGKIVPITVSDAEISAEFEKAKAFLPKKPPTISWKQIVIAPQATPAAKEAARQRAESLLVQIKGGADFEKIAKRESMDPLSKETGGDLGWIRRGTQFPEMERWLFGAGFMAATPPGQLTPVFETPYGFTIVRVDRVQPGEVKAHQILIVAKIDSADVARTAKLADSVAALWKGGTPFDSLAKKFHDYPGKEETNIPSFWRDSLPLTYQKGFLLHKPGDIIAFQIGAAPQRPDVPKYVVAQMLTADEGGDRTLGEMREAVRSELAQRGGVRRYIDTLKKQNFVTIRLDNGSAVDPAKPKP